MYNDEHISLNIPETSKQRVIIIGGGFGGINTAMKLRKKGFQVVLFDKHNYHTFQPLMYQVATAGLQPDSIAGPLRNIFKGYDDFYFRMFKVTAVDPVNNIVITAAGEIGYDYLVIAGGTKPNFYGNKQMEENALPLKSIPDALNLRSQFMQVLEKAELMEDKEARKPLLNIVLAGGGPTGVEMAGALAELRKHVLPKDYPQIDFKDMQIYLIEGAGKLLPPMSDKAGARAQKDLEKMGVIVKLNTMVDSYDGKTIKLKGGETIETATVVWSAGVMTATFPGLKPEWLEKGRILIDEYCRIPEAKNIFAIGDIALMKSEKWPKGHPGVAQVAIQMGEITGKNLVAIKEHQELKAFNYHDKGNLATIGRGTAVLDFPGGKFLGGRLAWWIWLFVHINYLVSFRNKILVFASWVWNYFTYDKGNRLIIRPYQKEALESSDPVKSAAVERKEKEVTAMG